MEASATREIRRCFAARSVLALKKPSRTAWFALSGFFDPAQPYTINTDFSSGAADPTVSVFFTQAAQT